MPRHGLFVEQRLRKLVESGAVEARVVAPVPWFPFKHSIFGSYGRFARVPQEELRHGIKISHPRFLQIPKVGMSLSPLFLAKCGLRNIRKLVVAGFNFDLIDAHYFYPDGVAAVKIASRLDKPVVVTARGTDLNLIPRYWLPRRMIQNAASMADGLITVCQALKDKLAELGIPGDKVSVLRNGVDLDMFRPTDAAVVRRELNVDTDQDLLVSAGNLIDIKGHDIPIRALTQLHNVHLLIAGEGDKERSLRELADKEGVADRVTFLGSVTQEKLRDYFSAANALVLASSREGMANVLLESMACGTPVVATRVGGTPEIVTNPSAGVLMAERSPDACVDAYRQLMANYPDSAATRQYAKGFGWKATTDGQLDLMRKMLRQREGRR